MRRGFKRVMLYMDGNRAAAGIRAGAFFVLFLLQTAAWLFFAMESANMELLIAQYPPEALLVYTSAKEPPIDFERIRQILAQNDHVREIRDRRTREDPNNVTILLTDPYKVRETLEEINAQLPPGGGCLFAESTDYNISRMYAGIRKHAALFRILGAMQLLTSLVLYLLLFSFIGEEFGEEARILRMLGESGKAIRVQYLIFMLALVIPARLLSMATVYLLFPIMQKIWIGRSLMDYTVGSSAESFGEQAGMLTNASLSWSGMHMTALWVMSAVLFFVAYRWSAGRST